MCTWVRACVAVGLFSYQTRLPGFGGFSLADHTLALTEGYQLKLAVRGLHCSAALDTTAENWLARVTRGLKQSDRKSADQSNLPMETWPSRQEAYPLISLYAYVLACLPLESRKQPRTLDLLRRKGPHCTRFQTPYIKQKTFSP